MKTFQTLLLLGAAAAVAFAAPNDPAPPQPGDVCGLCKAVVEQLGDEQTLTQVEQTLDAVCDFMPHFLHDTCKEFTGQVEEQIKDIAKSDPEDACEQVGLCPNEPEPETATPATNDGLGCQACKWAWQAIERSGPTADQLKDQLSTMCSMVPPDTKDQCDQAVTEIVQQYEEGIKKTPEDACEQLQLCEAKPHPTATSTSSPTATANHIEAIIHMFQQQMGTRKQLANDH